MNDDTSVNERLRALGERCIANEEEITRLRQKLTCCRCAESLEDGVAFCPKCAVEPMEPLRERVTALEGTIKQARILLDAARLSLEPECGMNREGECGANCELRRKIDEFVQATRVDAALTPGLSH